MTILALLPISICLKLSRVVEFTYCRALQRGQTGPPIFKASHRGLLEARKPQLRGLDSINSSVIHQLYVYLHLKVNEKMELWLDIALAGALVAFAVTAVFRLVALEHQIKRLKSQRNILLASLAEYNSDIKNLRAKLVRLNVRV